MLSAAAATFFVSAYLFGGKVDLTSGGVTASSGNSGLDTAVVGVSGSFVFRTVFAESLVGDVRFHVAVATAVASMLELQTGAGITADDVQINAATRRLASTPLLRGHARRLEGDYAFVDYIVFLDGSDAPEPEDATQILRSADPAAMATKIETEMTLQGFEEEKIVMEVISISADVFHGGDGAASPESGINDTLPPIEARANASFSFDLDKEGAGTSVDSSDSGLDKHDDRCFDHFGIDKAKCEQAGGLCQWMEGKCVIAKGNVDSSTSNDTCYEAFGNSRDQCVQEGGSCQWIEEDGVGKCTMRLHYSDSHGAGGADGSSGQTLISMRSCSQFDKVEACAGTDGLCQWIEDSEDMDGKCLPSIVPPNVSEQVAACRLKDEDRCLLASDACSWSGSRCEFRNFTDVCRDLFAADRDRCLKQDWLCQWTNQEGRQEFGCAMSFGASGGLFLGTHRLDRDADREGRGGGGGRRDRDGSPGNHSEEGNRGSGGCHHGPGNHSEGDYGDSEGGGHRNGGYGLENRSEGRHHGRGGCHQGPGNHSDKDNEGSEGEGPYGPGHRGEGGHHGSGGYHRDPGNHSEGDYEGSEGEGHRYGGNGPESHREGGHQGNGSGQNPGGSSGGGGGGNQGSGNGRSGEGRNGGDLGAGHGNGTYNSSDHVDGPHDGSGGHGGEGYGIVGQSSGGYNSGGDNGVGLSSGDHHSSSSQGSGRGGRNGGGGHNSDSSHNGSSGGHGGGGHGSRGDGDTGESGGGRGGGHRL